MVSSMKIALITGASQGIGSAIAQELNQKKIKVILVARSKAVSYTHLRAHET